MLETGSLVEVLREYKSSGGSIVMYEQAVNELKNLLLHLIKLEAKQNKERYTSATHWVCDRCHEINTEFDGDTCWKCDKPNYNG